MPWFHQVIRLGAMLAAYALKDQSPDMTCSWGKLHIFCRAKILFAQPFEAVGGSAVGQRFCTLWAYQAVKCIPVFLDELLCARLSMKTDFALTWLAQINPDITMPISVLNHISQCEGARSVFHAELWHHVTCGLVIPRITFAGDAIGDELEGFVDLFAIPHRSAVDPLWRRHSSVFH